MRKIIFLSIILFGVILNQTIDQQRVVYEKVFDLAAQNKNALHFMVRSEINGVKLNSMQIDELAQVVNANQAEIIDLLKNGVQDENDMSLIVDELVFNADKYFWKSPRTDSILKLQLAKNGDLSGVQYLIENARTRIYSAYRDYVLGQLNLLVGG